MIKKIITMTFILLLIQPCAHGKDRLKIVTSIGPLAWFIENIGGNRVDVTTLIPPGGNPHIYEPTPRQMDVLSKADLYVKVGSGIEFELMWMKRLESLNKKMPVCDASHGIRLMDMETNDHEADDELREWHKYGHGHHEGKDPHIWLSPVNAVIIAGNILKSLSEIDPAGTDYFAKNTSKLISELNDLKQKIDSKLKDIKKRQFYVFHPAWGYFAKEFDLEQVPIEYSGKEPTPERLEGLIKNARKQNIRAIFSSPQFSKKSAEVIAREINGKVLFIDPMAHDYLKNLEYTADLLKENME